MTATGTTLAEYHLSDMVARYRTEPTGAVGLELVPAHRLDEVCPSKPYRVDSLVQLALRGATASAGWAAGHTMRNSSSTDELRFRQQSVADDGASQTITTVLAHPTGLVATHRLRSTGGSPALEVTTSLSNEGLSPVIVEMVSSFSLGGLTPFREDEAFHALKVHRLRSVWSAEGRWVAESVEDLQLEPSWLRHGVRVERFGQVGSMPVRKYFPFVAVEDAEAGVYWAAQVACPSSWQIEVYRRDEALCVSGGLADFEFGHWFKTLAPGERLDAPQAVLTVASGSFDHVCQRLLPPYRVPPGGLLGAPHVVFNEFCTTWGKPSHASIVAQLEVLRGRGFSHFVIDAGWYADQQKGWNNNHGDWVVSDELFPDGLQRTVDAIRDAGLVPGIWFEWETCGSLTQAFQLTPHLLHRHGHTLTSGERRFWDMTDPWVVPYLAEKVIEFLRRYGFGYLKVDYNETIGVGCDGWESLGEGLRQQMVGTQAFFRRIREELPGILIENCSAGGHRLEASMMALCDYASFSDAHECLEIPLIAANLHRVIAPVKSQIWAVLRRQDSLRRICYSMVNTFLGVPCLSGDVLALGDEQWSCVAQGMAFYRSIFPLLQTGTTAIFGPLVPSYRSPRGWQAVRRVGPYGALVLAHSFRGEGLTRVEVPLEEDYKLLEIYGQDGVDVVVESRSLTLVFHQEFEAIAVHLRHPQERNHGVTTTTTASTGLGT